MYTTRWKIDPLKNSASPRMHWAVDTVIDLMKQSGVKIPRQKRYLRELRDHIKVILCNLISADGTGLDIWITFLKGHDYNNGGTSPTGFRFTTSYLNKVTDFLAEQGYIELKPGWTQEYDGGDAEVSKMRATPKLKGIHEVDPQAIFRDTFPVVIKGTKQLRIVRDRHGKPMKDERGRVRKIWKRDRCIVKDTRRVWEIKANLEVINRVLRDARIELDVDLHTLDQLNYQLAQDPDEHVRPIDFSHKQLYRVFLDRSYDVHGRFYGPWHVNLPEEYRDKILINGTPVKEFDFKAYHPSMLYCMENEPIPENIYHLQGYPDDPDGHWRKFIKQILLISINSKDDKATVMALSKDWTKRRVRAKKLGLPVPVPPVPIKFPQIMGLINKLRKRHEPVQHYFDDPGIGNRLMHYDSEIAERVMLHFARKGIPSLPVHYSFLVPLTSADECRWVMQEEFEKMFEQTIAIDGSFERGVLNAMGRMPALDRSPEWDRLESEITYLSKVDD